MSRALTTPHHDESRCVCGRLLARLTEAGIELKCPRCRRVVLIQWTDVRDDRPGGAGVPANER